MSSRVEKQYIVTDTTRDRESSVSSGTDLHNMTHVVRPAGGSMLPSHMHDGHWLRVYGNLSFCSAAGHETARKTQKPGISASSMTFTQRWINTQAV